MCDDLRIRGHRLIVSINSFEVCPLTLLPIFVLLDHGVLILLHPSCLNSRFFKSGKRRTPRIVFFLRMLFLRFVISPLISVTPVLVRIDPSFMFKILLCQTCNLVLIGSCSRRGHDMGCEQTILCCRLSGKDGFSREFPEIIRILLLQLLYHFSPLVHRQRLILRSFIERCALCCLFFHLTNSALCGRGFFRAFTEEQHRPHNERNSPQHQPPRGKFEDDIESLLQGYGRFHRLIKHSMSEDRQLQHCIFDGSSRGLELADYDSSQTPHITQLLRRGIGHISGHKQRHHFA